MIFQRFLLLMCAIGLFEMGAMASTLPPKDKSPTVAQLDKLLQVAAVIEDELKASGSSVILTGRSSTTLEKAGHRYSHSGIGIADASGRWLVKDLHVAPSKYAAPATQAIELGLSLYLIGSEQFDEGFFFGIILPEPYASQLRLVADDNKLLVKLMQGEYSMNAYPFSTKYLNCNQWILELFAASLQTTRDSSFDRLAAQNLLRSFNYKPFEFKVNSLSKWLAIRWARELDISLVDDDHPLEATRQGIYEVTMPSSTSAFVKDVIPDAKRVNFCYTDRYVLVRQGDDRWSNGCTKGQDDKIVFLKD